MTDTIFHVRKVSLGLKRKYRIAADADGEPGDLLAYAEKRLKLSDEIVLYRDRERRDLLATVKESSQGWRKALTGFETFDAAGALLGSFGVLVRKSIDRTTWELEQPGVGRFLGPERSARTASARRLLSMGGAAGEIAGALVKYHFDFRPEDADEGDGDSVFSIEKIAVLEDWYRLTVRDERLDQTLLFALAVTMEARQRH